MLRHGAHFCTTRILSNQELLRPAAQHSLFCLNVRRDIQTQQISILTNRGGWKTVRNPKLRQSRTKPAEATIDVDEYARTKAQQHRATNHCNATTERTEPRALDQKHHKEAAKTVKRPMNWSTKEPVSTKAMFMKAKNHEQARPTAAVKVTKSRMIA